MDTKMGPKNRSQNGPQKLVTKMDPPEMVTKMEPQKWSQKWTQKPVTKTDPKNPSPKFVTPKTDPIKHVNNLWLKTWKYNKWYPPYGTMQVKCGDLWYHSFGNKLFE